MRNTILLADDTKEVLSITKHFLESKGFDVICAEDGSTTLNLFKKHNVDLIILDMVLPKKDGLTVLKEIRRDYFSNVPVIIHTSVTDVGASKCCYDLDANDYIRKPFDLEFLLKKINYHIYPNEKSKNTDDLIWKYQHLEVNFLTNNILVNNHQINLGRTPFEILKFLFDNKGTVLSREQIINNVWETRKEINDRTIDSHISKIKKDLGIQCIKSVPGYGYILSF